MLLYVSNVWRRAGRQHTASGLYYAVNHGRRWCRPVGFVMAVMWQKAIWRV